MHATQTHRATSLVEVLVALSIVSLLIALTLPAIQQTRATAVRSRCANNLHQLALAFHHYHAAHNHLPAGVGAATGPRAAHPYLNWHACLLPYLEQAALWEQTLAAYRENKHFLSNPPHSAREAVLPVFTCPADGRTSQPAVFDDQKFGMTSYLGVAGLNSARHDGILYLGSEHRLGDVSDGTSNTLLVGERPPSPDLHYGWWYAGWGQDKDGECDGVLGVRTEPRPSFALPCDGSPERFHLGKFDNPCDMFHFWSPHPGGAHFLFADGSVRFLPYGADTIMPALASRAGGEVVEIP